ncbi:Ig-like domain-containing protein [Flavobacterium caeni]|uniref:Ig-like domain-containing protein n=1 Tax=Flavobacterium caeni TaxID=490189 RepID=A0A1G5H3G0_9FLAO|nr:Ig-like domain-containing protein [Flavobacterium caeni]SCY58221.1 Ig-like domain-containing protein [Flavobacterium caeni]
MRHLQFRIFIGLLLLAFTGCAKRGTITGGLKDTIAPTLKSAVPKNYATQFTGNTIKLTFDEYIKLKNINKQLIVSPPMKNAPDVLPTNASKYITIKINDTLQPNTTYSFNFGQSIEDNNESNPYRQFKYVFSTGSHIDSLMLNGRIKDAYAKEVDNFVTVMLYDTNERFNDSVVYNEFPRYVTNTLDSAKTFRLENLKAGKYLLVALKDKNNNYKFNPKDDKIGFHQQYVTIPNDTVYEIELFKEVLPFKPYKPVQASGNRLLVGYEGDPKDVTVSLSKAGQKLETIITKFPNKDSLQVWYKPIKLDAEVKSDSLQIELVKNNVKENFSVKIKNQKTDTLSIKSSHNGAIALRDKLVFTSSNPLKGVVSDKISLVNKDSAKVAFKTTYDDQKQELTLDFEKEPLQKYQLELLPGALVDYLEQANDTLRYKLETKNTSEFGNLRLLLENVKQFPIIIELTDSKGTVLYSDYSEDRTTIDFNLIKPELFTLRVIYDANKNKVWDTGNFLEKRQSEEVIYYPKEIDVRANWDVEQNFNLAAP